MDFSTLFGLFYTKYRGEESPPTTTDPEWAIAVRNYNSALDRLESYDDTRWDFLKTTLQASAALPADYTMLTGATEFTAPSDMLFPGGLFWKINLNGFHGAPYKIYKPEDVGTLSSGSTWGYFLGDQHNGYTFYLNPSVYPSEDGYTLNYMYYKKAPRLDPDTEDGTSIITGGTSEYFANYMAAQRFMDSRNFPAYQLMKRDSEDALKSMRLRNNSGDYYNVPAVQDTGPGWGI